MGCAAARQQFVEVRGTITDTIGAGDNDLPTLVGGGPSLGNGNGDAQPHRRRGSLASRCVYDEGHGITVLRDRSMISRFGVSQVIAAPAISVPVISDR